MIYYAEVCNNKVLIRDRKGFNNDLKQYEGKRVEVEIREAKKRRSNDQNAYYWSTVLPLAMEGLRQLGNERLSLELVHRFFKDKFLERWQDIVIPSIGEVYKVKTTTDLTTSEMMTYIEEISRFCAEMLNVIIPEPNER